MIINVSLTLSSSNSVNELTGSPATVKNNKLYIDGGTQTFVSLKGSNQTGNITVGYNSVLIQVDLSKSWDWKTNISETYINKTGIANVISTPALSRGALYGGMDNDTNIYLYGGTTSYINTSDPAWQPPTSSRYSLFSYDTASGNVAQFNISGESPYRPSSGAYATAPDQGLAFYLGGEVNSGSSIETQILGDTNKFFLDGMIVIDTNTRTASNLSTTKVADGVPRTYASMQYIPGVGENGILVHLGGSDMNGNLLPLDSVDIFNINSLYNDTAGTWVSQATTGDIPISRVSGCVVMASAQDNSSHNIYMYGGRGSGNQYFDQVYVLSIPSFTWTKLYQGTSPRFAHTCHLVANRQMLTVGGIGNNPLTSGPCDYQTKGVNIFDLSTLQFRSVYNVNAPPYVVPAPIIAKIGGSGTGGSNITYPIAINELFNPTVTPPTPPPSPSSSKLSGGAIAGAVIGSILGVILLCAALWFFCFRRRRHYRDTEAEAVPVPPEKDFRPSSETKNFELVGQHGGTELGRGHIRRAEMEGNRAVEMWQQPVELPLQK
ncbi:MAG: hypothetical protein Q9187_003073 [Circinaria calcarea]